MIKYLVIATAAFFVALFVLRAYMNAQAKKTVQRFELGPEEEGERESFMDPKTGKRYDKNAYNAYLKVTVQKLTDQQLSNMANQYGQREDIWSQLMCEAVRAEEARRAEAAAEQAEEEDTLSAEMNDGSIAPFFWVEQQTGASVGLTTGEYLQDLFEAHHMAGSGADWDRLAKLFLREQNAGLRRKLEFDSQEDLFSVYSRDVEALEQFIETFRDVCEDTDSVSALLDRLAE